jgi:glycosyltransferase involved in cell wall biosynthesis
VSERIELSVIIPAYNPQVNRLQQTLDALKHQSLASGRWECIIVDNGTTNGGLDAIKPEGIPHFRLVKELRPGLTHARIKGYRESAGNLLLFVDDDNVLSADYLSTGLSLFRNTPQLGVAGGRSIGSFESEPEEWQKTFFALIAVRPEKHPTTITTDLSAGYPAVSPIGAGMFVTRQCFGHYIAYVGSSDRAATDRTGNQLSSGGDNEINIIALKSGFMVGFFPELMLTHLIPSGRMIPAYLKKLNYASNRSWVKLLHNHNICPWKPISKLGCIVRMLRAYFRYQPWKNNFNAITYQGICGMFKGLSELN